MKTYKNHPPVPTVLQDALKDYPELIAGLQEALTKTGLTLFMSKTLRYDQFEIAIALLEGRLDTYWSDAAEEVKAAEATGDAALIAKAKEKEMLMIRCRRGRLRDSLDELERFFA